MTDGMLCPKCGHKVLLSGMQSHPCFTDAKSATTEALRAAGFDDVPVQAHFNTWTRKHERTLSALDVAIEMARFQWQIDRQALAHERGRAEKLVKALEAVETSWDVTNPANVIPKHHAGELARNDSLAAGAIWRCVETLKAYRAEGK